MKPEQIVPHNTHDDDDLEIGSGDKLDTDDNEEDDEDIDEGEDVHKVENGSEKTVPDYDDNYDEEENPRSGLFDTDSSPKVTVPHIGDGKSTEKKADSEDDDDFTTYVKQTEIDSTTTTVTEERQLHGFVFHLFICNSFNFTYLFVMSFITVSLLGDLRRNENGKFATRHTRVPLALISVHIWGRYTGVRNSIFDSMN